MDEKIEAMFTPPPLPTPTAVAALMAQRVPESEEAECGRQAAKDAVQVAVEGVLSDVANSPALFTTLERAGIEWGCKLVLTAIGRAR